MNARAQFDAFTFVPVTVRVSKLVAPLVYDTVEADGLAIPDTDITFPAARVDGFYGPNWRPDAVDWNNPSASPAALQSDRATQDPLADLGLGVEDTLNQVFNLSKSESVTSIRKYLKRSAVFPQELGGITNLAREIAKGQYGDPNTANAGVSVLSGALGGGPAAVHQFATQHGSAAQILQGLGVDDAQALQLGMTVFRLGEQMANGQMSPEVFARSMAATVGGIATQQLTRVAEMAVGKATAAIGLAPIGAAAGGVVGLAVQLVVTAVIAFFKSLFSAKKNYEGIASAEALMSNIDKDRTFRMLLAAQHEAWMAFLSCLDTLVRTLNVKYALMGKQRFAGGAPSYSWQAGQLTNPSTIEDAFATTWFFRHSPSYLPDRQCKNAYYQTPLDNFNRSVQVPSHSLPQPERINGHVVFTDYLVRQLAPWTQSVEMVVNDLAREEAMHFWRAEHYAYHGGHFKGINLDYSCYQGGPVYGIIKDHVGRGDMEAYRQEQAWRRGEQIRGPGDAYWCYKRDGKLHCSTGPIAPGLPGHPAQQREHDKSGVERLAEDTAKVRAGVNPYATPIAQLYLMRKYYRGTWGILKAEENYDRVLAEALDIMRNWQLLPKDIEVDLSGPDEHSPSHTWEGALWWQNLQRIKARASKHGGWTDYEPYMQELMNNVSSAKTVIGEYINRLEGLVPVLIQGLQVEISSLSAAQIAKTLQARKKQAKLDQYLKSDAYKQMLAESASYAAAGARRSGKMEGAYRSVMARCPAGTQYSPPDELRQTLREHPSPSECRDALMSYALVHGDPEISSGDYQQGYAEVYAEAIAEQREALLSDSPQLQQLIADAYAVPSPEDALRAAVADNTASAEQESVFTAANNQLTDAAIDEADELLTAAGIDSRDGAPTWMTVGLVIGGLAAAGGLGYLGYRWWQQRSG